MNHPLRLRFFAHSWLSDWNHGNAHFLRGLVSELQNLGHEVRCYEEQNSWSYTNLLHEDLGPHSIEQFTRAFPDLDVRRYQLDELENFVMDQLREADVVVIHEWNSPKLAEVVLALKKLYGFRLLLHDTHHRAYTRPREIAQLGVDKFDGVLAFGEAIRKIYSSLFKTRAWTFHEAADTARFFPRMRHEKDEINWVGNWGDGERTGELQEYLIGPLSSQSGFNTSVYGVRYPAEARELLERAGIRYRGYLPNLSAPDTYSRSLLTLHIPRRYYANGLSGIPTIRMFEAFACGVPLVCSPWTDQECLFRANEDYLCVSDGRQMQAEIAWLISDPEARCQMATHAFETVLSRHTCLHRARQFEEICQELSK